MSEDRRRRGEVPRDPSEGVRIIGADEAADAVGRETQRQREADGERSRRRPSSQPDGGSPPALRFPLDSSADLDRFPRPSAAPSGQEQRLPASELSHWADSAPEEVPSMSPQDPYQGDDGAAWSAFAGAGPRWRDDDPPPPGGPGRRPPYQREPVVFDEFQRPSAGHSVFDGPPRQEGAPLRDTYEDDYSDRGYGDQSYGDRYSGAAYDTSYDDGYADDGYDYAEPEPTAAPPPHASRARPKVRAQAPSGTPSGDRDMRKAVAVGVGLLIGALFLFQIDPVAVLLLVTALLGLASLEYFTVTQRAGFDPLMPVGVAATVALPLTAFYYGERGIPLVMVLSVAVCLVWYLIGAGGERPMANVGATLLGIAWIGLFGSFAGLLLMAPNGEALLVAAIIPTIGYDVGALFVGRSAGSRPLSPASPNKTMEGLAGGMVLAVVAGVLLGVAGPHPFTFADGLLIGLVAAMAAPLGDLSQSLLKRDLGIKDMGSILPGHGGVLDRFDGVLFVLPAIWYLAVVRDGFIG